VSGALQTVRSAAWVYGRDPGLDDPAELCHEASKLRPATAAGAAAGAALLEARPELQATVERCVRRRSVGVAYRLPSPELPPTILEEALRRRRSERTLGGGHLDLRDAAALLWAGYGVARRSQLGPRRTVPSGGALYPLELYVLALRVRGLASGVYHYDPLRHALFALRGRLGREELELLTPSPELVLPSALVVLVTGIFWRTRFKYGLRGYRFTLLEAGHVGQNVLLAAAALDLAAAPLGGVYDGRVEELLGVNGVDESLVYTLCVGTKVAE
jgi:SagB-type dehydrogenase family enzyme